MKTLIFSYPDNETISNTIARQLNAPMGDVVFRSFPDQETYLQIKSDVKDKYIIIVCSLFHPNEKIIPLLFFAKTAKDLGAKSVGLIAPYLSYMRQDKRFLPGESINSRIFGDLISHYYDWLITVDPHLHRHKALCEIYSIKTAVLHSTNLIADWISHHVQKPVIVGPDAESSQWVKAVAKKANAPFLILEKIRRGDRDVEISVPNIHHYLNHTPVLVDDIISTARTMIETIKHLHHAKMPPAVCICVHAVFANHAYQDLLHAGIHQVITCNSIAHESNVIDISPILIDSIKKFLNET